ncbi:GNAT family N-acetyltransferase [Thermomonas carbonis]|uniref:GNAT family N-acetyltransferase n=1 Tax=Thermomonas carbonis TaxID=1463158 RepID=A0A7G9SPR0_9GAMM|nr:GNAT family protein [Thermomonas carbonis]QNN69835.1 GNAT family N-acetyltransferase [Thermomonas carbonis]GHB95817.1 N-acetyltransferase [Thermomonas carbonis]
MNPTLATITLAGHGIRLEPLTLAHVPALQDAVDDGDIGSINYVNVPGRDGIPAWIEHALAMRDAGRELPFAIISDGRVVGSTRFYDIDLSVPTLAIGYTFHAASVWRTHVNTANKRLMLGHAFDALGAKSVFFHTSHLNLRSQAAIERLGAQRDGILRAHRRHKDGSLRDTVTYSIVADEWPAIRERLDARLATA